jgi:menaquinone-dependent protoporphyrinogen oxidase
MRVLVTTANDGVTDAIGARISSVLGGRGHQVDVRTPAEVITVDSYDVIVLGSAVDDGHWQEEARLLVLREVADISARPVWLFSSGTGDRVSTAGDVLVDVSDVMRATHAFEHRLFAGGASKVGGTATAVLEPEDDEDAWADVDRWATAIADSISSG